ARALKPRLAEQQGQGSQAKQLPSGLAPRAHARMNHSKIKPATPAPLVWRVSRGPAKVLWGPPGREDLGGAKKRR
ncbi:hypothetical protein, partial [Paenibacillus pabuli]|uniref:hypothetical protein n=1 Tax=Paenibacillus pabuli TaxID=1472 RepID=UPI002DB7EB23